MMVLKAESPSTLRETAAQAVAKPDAVAISQAAICHLKGDPQGALEHLASVPPEHETIDLLRARGYIQMDLERFEDAAASYAAVVEKDPHVAEDRFQWGFCLQKTGHAAEALDQFEKAQSLGAVWIEVVLARSICHLTLKQYPKTIEAAQECLNRNPAYVPALFTMAVALHLTWELDQAVNYYQQVLEHEPASVFALMNLVSVGLQQRKYDFVERYARELISIEPDNLQGLEGLATAAFFHGDYSAAQDHYRRLTELVPDQVEFWLNRGISYHKQSLLGDALQCFTRARRVRSNSIQAYTHMGRTLRELGDLAGARACYEDAIDQWPDRDDVALNLSHVLESLELVGPAEEVCREFCERTPGKEQVWFRLGFLQWQRGAIEGAIDSFGRACELRPEWAAAEINLGLVLTAAGQLHRAEAVLAPLCRREPRNVEAAKAIAALALKEQDHARALDLHLRLLDLGETTAEVYYNCGVLAQALDRPEDAVEYYRQAVAIRGDFAEALLNLGHAMEDTGKHAEAKQFWIPALELNPELARSYFRHGSETD